MYLYCKVCGSTSVCESPVEEGSEPTCDTCGIRTQILYSHMECSPERKATSEFFDDYDLWLERHYGVPVSDPDTAVDDPGDRQGWEES